MRRWGQHFALWVALAFSGTAAAPAAPEVTITLPPANYDESEGTYRTMGRIGGHLHLHYFTLGAGYYVWFRQGSASPDPGATLSGMAAPLVPGLAGLTGIRVDLPASAQTDVQVATAVAAAIDAVSGLSATSSGADVTVVGVATAAAGTTPYSSVGREGIIGTPDNRTEAQNSFATASLRASLLDSSDWGDVPIVITGFALGVGDTHTTGCVVAIYQGGTADNETGTATLLGHVGTTAGDGTIDQYVTVQSNGVYVDPSLGRVWVAFMADSGFEASFTWYSQSSATGNNYITTSNNAVHLVTAGPSSSDSADLPTTLGATASSELGMLALRLAFVEAGAFQNHMAPTFAFGTLAGLAVGERDTTFTFASSTDDGLIVGNAFNVPADMRGLELHRSWINYDTHVSGSDYAALVGVGGAAVDDMDGSTFYFVGQTSGTATGWNPIDAPSGIPLAAGTRVRLVVKYDGEPDPGPRSAIAFDSGGSGDQYEDDHWGSATWYAGNTSESEYAPLDNPIVSAGQETTNVDYDPSVADPVGVWNPNGVNFTSDNNVGTYGEAETTGFAIAS